MKYSEYLQLREMLDNADISWEDYKKNPKLYEGVLSTLGRGLLQLAKKGMQAAVSKGISVKHKDELNNTAEKIRAWILKEVEIASTDEKHPLYKTIQRKNEAKKIAGGQGENARQAKRIVQSTDREIAQFIRKKVNLQVKNIEKKIDKNKVLTDKDKEALGEYWDDLSINLELAVSQALHDADIIEEETMEDWLKKIRGEEPMRRDRKTRKGTSTSTQKTKDTAVTPEKEPLIKNN
jgi:hypothetical protein